MENNRFLTGNVPAPRNVEILRLRQQGWTITSIARKYAISRQRVSQIVRRTARLLGVDIPGWKCPDCGTDIRPWNTHCCRCKRRWSVRRCRRCGIEFTVPTGVRTLFCERCRSETRPCAWCGKPITRMRGTNATAFRHRLWFCNRHCFGTWAGNNHGWGAKSRLKSRNGDLPPDLPAGEEENPMRSVRRNRWENIMERR